jgi:hypothetical protein
MTYAGHDWAPPASVSPLAAMFELWHSDSPTFDGDSCHSVSSSRYKGVMRYSIENVSRRSSVSRVPENRTHGLERRGN